MAEEKRDRIDPQAETAGLPVHAPDEGRPARDSPPLTPKQIGRYHLKHVIGSGGMGTVYVAVQERPRRTVALKLMKAGIASRSALRRFEYESQILARLRHANIAQVYESGTHDDGTGRVPFFAMEYIPGAKTITAYAEDKELGTRQRLQLFAKVCDAVHHGHQKGIIHRDLKPGNILVDSCGEPKIIDFGVARATDSDIAVTTLQTDIGELIGTLQYMSPEQCEADPHDLDTRSDVYALGVVLYELLCGRLPYDVSRTAVHEAARVVRESKPARPSTINRTLRGDVETITLKAMEKDRARRYQSAGDLGQDIQRYLNNEPIEARPPSVIYQVRMFARRHRAAFGAIAAVFLALSAAFIVSAIFAVREARARSAEAEQRVLAEDRLAEVRQAQAAAEAAREAERSAKEQAQGALALAEQRKEEAEEEAGNARAINDFLTDDLLAAVAPSAEAGRGRDVLMRDVLDAASEKIEEASRSGGRFADKPLIEASIRTALGETYLWLGEYPTAEPHFQLARQLRERELGEEHPATLASMSNLAYLYVEQGRYVEAEPLCIKTLEIRRRVLGEEHPATLASINNLAHLYSGEGRYDEAEALYLKTLEVRKRVLGEEDLSTITSMDYLAGAYLNQGRYDEAEPLFVRALEITKRIMGEEDPSTTASMSNLASAYMHQGRYDEAEPLLVETLEIKKRVLGEEHPQTLVPMETLAILYDAQGRYDEAEPLYLRTLEIKERTLGEEHPDTLGSITNLGLLYLGTTRFDEARAMFERSLPIKRRVLGLEHPWTQYAMEGLAEAYDRLDRADDALPLWCELHEFQLARVEAPNASVEALNAAAWGLLTNERTEFRDPARALLLAQRAVDGTGGVDPVVLDTLALAQFMTGDITAAIETEKKALSLLPADAPSRAGYEAALARFEAALKNGSN
jgi:tetratricopeptide (TPR) repeat protein/tRNA A-37 threonylcarbamoyl transferase component Bud32